jgi:hypothetical protein
LANTRLAHKRTSTSGLLPNTTNSGNTAYITAGEFAVNLTDQLVVGSTGTAPFYVGANVPAQYVGGVFLANSTTLAQSPDLVVNATGVFVNSAFYLMGSNGTPGRS